MKGGEYHKIPYNGQFLLRKSYIRNLETATWWKEFAFLLPPEISSLKEILTDSEEYTKSLMRLQWLRKTKLRIVPTSNRALVAIIINTPLSGQKKETPSSSGQPKSGLESVTAFKPTDNASKVGSGPLLDDLSKEFILYVAYTIRVFEPYNRNVDPRSVTPTIIKEGFSEADIMRRISELDNIGPQLIEKKLKLLAVQHEQITKLLEELSSKEINTGFAWTLAQIDDITISGEGVRPLTVYLRKVLVAVPDTYSGEWPDTQPIPTILRAMPVRVPPASIIPEMNSTTKKDGIPSIPRPNVTFETAKQKARGKKREDSPDMLIAEKGKEYGRSGTFSMSRKYGTKQPTGSRSTTRPMDNMHWRSRDDSDDAGSGVQIPSFISSSNSPSPTRGGERPPIPNPWDSTFPTYPPYGYPSSVNAPYPGMLPYNPTMYAPPVTPFYGATSYPPHLISPYNNISYSAPYYGHAPYLGVPQAPPSAPDVPYFSDDGNPFLPIPQPVPVEPTGPQGRGSASHLDTQKLGNPFAAMKSPPPPGPRPTYEKTSQLPALPSAPAYLANKRSYLDASSSYAGSSRPQHKSSEPAIPLQRPRVPYPEYYDGRAYNPLDAMTEKQDNNDIVQKLLMDWTPAGDEHREKIEKAKSSVVGNN